LESIYVTLQISLVLDTTTSDDIVWYA